MFAGHDPSKQNQIPKALVGDPTVAYEGRRQQIVCAIPENKIVSLILLYAV